ncbi:unnamed protein product [Didymodactylos carnosus]|uniref:Uncharacterized protein n=1 Tax=Didymodactylos carnosus TaxID=1234261 RepID=A0A8S2P2T1_9BILA|nr:unnamed protein product [Didymodactylos carnosus]CAF4025389.1 unnamed protein product [Didymodactylos carnosus]
MLALVVPNSVQAKFAFNALPEKYKSKLKDAELRFAVAGSHSCNALENDGILTLVHTGIDEIGADIGLVDVCDVFYRKTIREEALVEFDEYVKQIRSTLDETIKQHCLTATPDLWTDNLMKRRYLDFYCLHC